jgi:hypothetical protein
MLFLKFGSGRYLFHSLLFVVISFLILFIITKGDKQISFSLLIGMLFHLLLDLPDIPLFFPFIQYDFKRIEDPIPMWLHTLLTDPIVQITEMIGALLLIFIFYKNRLYKSGELLKFLKTYPQTPYYLKQESKNEIKIVED